MANETLPGLHVVQIRYHGSERARPESDPSPTPNDVLIPIIRPLQRWFTSVYPSSAKGFHITAKT